MNLSFPPSEILGSLPAGRVLDVATGPGGFIHFLLAGLPGYQEIIGIDSAERMAAPFAQAFADQPNIRFRVMDARRLEFMDEAFDLVCISNSLHHFPAEPASEGPAAVLAEMLRVLRPGGHLLVSEMYRDNQTETQQTHVELHHWWGAVDAANGIVHRETYTRQELVYLVAGLGLTGLTLYDLADSSEDPRSPELIAELAPVFDRYIQRAAGHPELQQRGEELRQRVAEIGFHSATTLVALARK